MSIIVAQRTRTHTHTIHLFIHNNVGFYSVYSKNKKRRKNKIHENVNIAPHFCACFRLIIGFRFSRSTKNVKFPGRSTILSRVSIFAVRKFYKTLLPFVFKIYGIFVFHFLPIWRFRSWAPDANRIYVQQNSKAWSRMAFVYSNDLHSRYMPMTSCMEFCWAKSNFVPSQSIIYRCSVSVSHPSEKFLDFDEMKQTWKVGFCCARAYAYTRTCHVDWWTSTLTCKISGAIFSHSNASHTHNRNGKHFKIVNANVPMNATEWITSMIGVIMGVCIAGFDANCCCIVWEKND